MSTTFLEYAASILTVQQERMDTYLMKLYCVWEVLLGELGLDDPTNLEMNMFLRHVIPNHTALLNSEANPDQEYFRFNTLPQYAHHKITTTVTVDVLESFVDMIAAITD